MLLAPVTTKSVALSAAAESTSQVSFGSMGTEYSSYKTEPSVVVMADMNSYLPTYDIEDFGFGLVYTSDNTQYFANLTNPAPAVWTASFDGMGLPSTMFEQFNALLANASDNAGVCETTNGGNCYFNQTCNNYPDIMEYSFQMKFSGVQNYMRVPLSLFASNTTGNKCVLAISNLDSDTESSSNVILGGLFFQNFYGVFTNTYDASTGLSNAQEAQLFVQLNTKYNASYIGDEQLAQGTNPFYNPVTPSSSSSANLALIISLSVVGFLLLVVLGIVLYKYCSGKNSDSNGTGQSEYKVVAHDNNMHSSSPNIQDDEDDM